MLKADIADARQRGGLPIETAAETPAAMSAEPRVGRVAVETHATIQGRVRLIAELASKASPDDTVIVIARAVGGSAMPLAVIKRQVKDLPVNFTLDDSIAVAPEAKLSAFTQVNITARISKSNAVTIQHGDLVSEPIHTIVGAANVDIPIPGVVR